jgi:hypothetical protein
MVVLDRKYPVTALFRVIFLGPIPEIIVLLGIFGPVIRVLNNPVEADSIDITLLPETVIEEVTRVYNDIVIEPLPYNLRLSLSLYVANNEDELIYSGYRVYELNTTELNDGSKDVSFAPNTT